MHTYRLTFSATASLIVAVILALVAWRYTLPEGMAELAAAGDMATVAELAGPATPTRIAVTIDGHTRKFMPAAILALPAVQAATRAADLRGELAVLGGLISGFALYLFSRRQPRPEPRSESEAEGV